MPDFGLDDESCLELRRKHAQQNYRRDREGCQVTHREGRLSQTNREGGVPEFGMPLPARDYPSAPTVDLKHDRGNCAVGDVRDRWKDSKQWRGYN